MDRYGVSLNEGIRNKLTLRQDGGHRTVTRMTRFNEQIGPLDKAHVYTSLDDRRRFNKAMIELVKANSVAATDTASACFQR